MSLVNETAAVVSNQQLGPRLFLLRLTSPQIATSIKPGQFVHMQIPGMPDHILRRPFSVYSSNVKEGIIDILYQVVGYGSDFMTTLEMGAQCELIGPVGHGWVLPDSVTRTLIVGGGVGAAPLYMLAEDLCEAGVSTTMIIGAANKDCLVTYDRYNALAQKFSDTFELICATDDGSFGVSGFCTVPAQDAIDKSKETNSPYDYVAVCGPEPLMKAVSGISTKAGIYTQLSMEKRMACGIGACLSCVVETIDGRRRACVDGPVFDADKVVW